MSLLRAWVFRFAGLFNKAQSDAELTGELESHLQMHIEDELRAGITPVEARRQALIKLGGIEQTKENYRDRRSIPWLETLLQDARFSLRMMSKNLGFTAVALLTLALGIGANTAIFSVVYGVVLAPLPYPEPDRLVVVWESNPRFPKVDVSYPNFQDRQRSAGSFEQMAAFARQGYDLTSPGTPDHLDGKEISAGFFSTLGVKLVLGREFSPTEDMRGGAPVVVISNRLWKDRFAGSPEALGKSLVLSGVDYEVVGVLPPRFQFLTESDVYTPLGQGDPVVLNARGAHWIFSFGRLKPGISASQAQAEMKTVQTGLDRLYPDADRDLGIAVVPLKEQIIGNVRATLLLLWGAVGLVLLIACANVANLLLARSAARNGEFAIRAALGANRARLVRQLLTESALLSLAGGALGVLVAVSGISPVLSALPGSLPRGGNVDVKTPVLLFTLILAFVVGILFGLVPALKSSKADLQSSLKEGGRGFASSHHRAQSVLVSVQMALTLVLLVGAGLLFRTIRHLWEVNPGFDTQHVITFKIGVSPSQTRTAASTRVAYQQLIERIRRIPGVQAADFTALVPLSGSDTEPFWIGSRKPFSVQAAPRLLQFLTGPDYIRTMGIPLLRGRFFTLEDTTKSPCVVVIDSVFAQMYFPDSDPLSQTITAGFVPFGPCRIIGIVGHVKHWGLGNLNAYPQNQAYFSLYQDPDQWVPINYRDATMIIHTPLDTATAMPAVKSAVYGAGSDQPVYDVQAMREIVSESIAFQRFPMILLGEFATVALLLACVGVYGVISYSVAQRVHEIGIRMALGAEKHEIFRMVIGQGVRLALFGLAIGSAVALVLSRLLSSFSRLLYGVGTSDPLTFIVVSIVLLVVAILASWVPARRATRVDPMVALRYE